MGWCNLPAALHWTCFPVRAKGLQGGVSRHNDSYPQARREQPGLRDVARAVQWPFGLPRSARAGARQGAKAKAGGRLGVRVRLAVREPPPDPPPSPPPPLQQPGPGPGSGREAEALGRAPKVCRAAVALAAMWLLWLFLGSAGEWELDEGSRRRARTAACSSGEEAWAKGGARGMLGEGKPWASGMEPFDAGLPHAASPPPRPLLALYCS